MRLKLAKQIIGWREWVSFPELGVDSVKGKIDTGAQSCALHAYDIECYKTRTGRKKVKFYVHPIQRNNKLVTLCHADLSDQRWVKSSSGQKELRTTILTLIQMGSTEWPTYVTLTNRDSMGFRLLVGRATLQGRFIIDPQKSFLLPNYK